MRIQMTGKRVELTDSIKAFAKEKIERLAKYHNGITKVQLVLSPDFVARASARRSGKVDPESMDVQADGADGKTPAVEPAEPGGRPRILPEVSGRVISAELVLTVRKERPFVARARGESWQAAIDVVVDKMERQLCKHKEKLADKRQSGREEY